MILNNKYISLPLLSILIAGCGGGGGGGGGGSSSPSTSPVINQTNPSTLNSEPYYKYAWHFNQSIDSSFKSNNTIDSSAHVNILTAWNETTGKYTTGSETGQPVKIAIIDDNFNTNHEDLKDSIISKCNFDNFTFSGSTSSINSSSVTTHCNNISNQNVLPVANESSHGTSVANFITATQNSKGLIGSAPDASLIVIKQQYVDDAKTVAAFEYARTMGAKVINCSWSTPVSQGGVSSAVSAKIQELKDDGITIVFASGNDNKDMNADAVIEESELDTVISVGSSNKNNERSSFSNYSPKMDILAPGGGDGVGVLSAFVPNSSTSATNNGLGDIDTLNYSFTQGTSFSAPITTGVIALMISVNPSITPDQIRTSLIETADKIGTGASYTDIGGDGTSSTFDTFRAYGKLNATAAVNRAKTP